MPPRGVFSKAYYKGRTRSRSRERRYARSQSTPRLVNGFHDGTETSGHTGGQNFRADILLAMDLLERLKHGMGGLEGPASPAENQFCQKMDKSVVKVRIGLFPSSQFRGIFSGF